MPCNLCPLQKKGIESTSFEGNENADLMFIGEAAGEREEVLGLPFQGRAGQLLNDMLKKAEIDRKDIYIANIVKCRPPDNNIKCESAKQALKICPQIYLLPAIRRVNPKVIVIMGNIAHKFFFGKEGISKARGSLKLWNGYKVISTYHPAFLLRGNNQFVKEVINDFIYAKSLINQEKTEIKFKIVRTTDDFDLMIKDLENSKKVSFDTETSGLEPYKGDQIIGMSFSKDRDFSYYVPYKQRSFFGDTFEYVWNDKYNKWLKDFIENSDIKKALQNANFDMEFLSVTEGIELRGLAIDTLVIAHLLDENRSNTLENLTNLYYPDLFGYKEKSKSFLPDKGVKDFSKLPLEVLAERGAIDAIATYRLAEDLLKELKADKELFDYYVRFKLPLIPLLVKIQKRGFRVDLEYAKKLKTKYEKSIEDLQNKIWGVAGYKFNINSDDQLRELFRKFNFPVTKLTEISKEQSTDKESLLQIKEETGHPLIDLLFDYNKVTKLYSTYIMGMITHAVNGRIHSKLNVSGTDTGRLSSTRPSQHTIAKEKDIKNLVIAEEGYSFIYADFSTAEVRVLANLSKDENLMLACTSGQDVYATMANQSLNRNDIVKSSPERNQFKVITLATLYGMGCAAMAKSLKIAERRAINIQKKFFGTFKKTQNWIIETKRFVHTYGYVRTIYGRIRHLPKIHSNDNESVSEAERQAVNTKVQSATSDYVTMALKRVDEKLKDFDGRIIITVHDSMLVEIKDEQVEEFIPIMREAMIAPVLPIDIAMAVNVEVGKRWGTMEEFD